MKIQVVIEENKNIISDNTDFIKHILLSNIYNRIEHKFYNLYASVISWSVAAVGRSLFSPFITVESENLFCNNR